MMQKFNGQIYCNIQPYNYRAEIKSAFSSIQVVCINETENDTGSLM